MSAAPQLEDELAVCLAEALGMAAGELRRDRPLTACGLDSLAAIAVAHAAERRLGVALAAEDLLAGTTLRELAAALAARDGAAGPPAAAATAGAATTPPGIGEMPSRGQRALWLVEQLGGTSPFTLALAATVRSPLDPEAAARAWARLLARHESLRSRFPAPAGEPRREVDATPRLGWSVWNARGWSNRQLAAVLAAHAGRGFDLASGPLVRAALFLDAPGGDVLLLAAHHLIIDLWSLAVALAELAALYRAERGGPKAVLPPLAASYGDYVRAQEELLAGPAGERLWGEWRARLAGAPTVLDLPADRPRPPRRTCRGGRVRLRLSRPASEALAALAAAGRGTLAGVLLAGFAALVARLAGCRELLIGVPSSGRLRPEWAGLVGYLVNPLALRLELGGEPGFGALAALAGAELRAALARQAFPFALLVERLEPERDPARAPLFQVACVHQRAPSLEAAGLVPFALGEPGATLALEGLQLAARPLPQRAAELDLALGTCQAGTELVAVLDYSADLWDEVTMARWGEHWSCLLAAAAADPELPVAALPLLPAMQRQQLLREWSGAARCPGRGRASGVEELFAAQAARTPEAIALASEAEAISYGELDRRTNRLARRLRARGVAAEVVVALLVPRSPMLVVAMLAVAKAGGAFLVLDPDAPDKERERTAGVLRQASPALLLAPRAELASAAALLASAHPGASALALERLEAEAAAEPGEDLGAAAPPAALAYVLFTSGSTGEPKGVLVPRGALAGVVAESDFATNLGPGDVMMQVFSPLFDASLIEIFFPLTRGARLLVHGDPLARGPAGLLALAARDGVTLLSMTTALWHEVTRELATGGAALPTTVRELTFGGDAASPAAWEWWRRERPGVGLVNGYGPTETTILATTWRAWQESGPPPAAARAVPVGRPIVGARVRLLDAGLEPVPVGVPGELCIGGIGVGRGYLGRPALTAERFIPDPLEGGPYAARLYRSGDLARWRRDGALELLGRLDRQLKIRGFRVEPAEVEAALLRHPAVAEAAVLAEAEGAGQRLVAYLASPCGPPPATLELRRFLAERLSPYMVPARFFWLARLPRTAGGKLDRRALPAAGAERPALGTPFAAPQTPLEAALAALWSEALGIPEIGVHDDFFALGGHSLLAARVVARARATLGRELALTDLFAHPTVAALARHLAAARPEDHGALPLGGRRGGPAEREAPLAPAQLRVWFLHQLAPGNPCYNLPLALLLPAGTSPPALAAALTALGRRHAALRTTLAARGGGEPVQRIAAAPRHHLAVADLAACGSGARRERETWRLLTAVARRPFDLAAGPLIRAVLLTGPGASPVLALCLHHAICDGWSAALLLRELAELYAAAAARRAPFLPAAAVEYADFASWQRSWLAGATAAGDLAWWRERLAGAPERLALPVDRERQGAPSFRSRLRRLGVAAADAAALRALARRQGATLFMGAAAAVFAYLWRVTATDDLLLGAPVAGRDRVELEGVVGMFVNTLTLRLDLAGEPAGAELLGRVRAAALGAYAHGDLPFERLVEELRPARDLAAAPLLQAVLAIEDDPLAPLAFPGLPMQPLPLDPGTVRFDLELHLWPAAGGGLGGYLAAAADLFDGATVERMAGHLARLLAAIGREPERRVAELPLLSAPEAQQLVEAAPGPGAPPSPAAPRLDRLLEVQAAAHAAAVAVTCGAEYLTYGELLARARLLARALARLGVGRGDRVALYLSRSPRLVEAVAGTLLAGAAYVPVDPGTPRARLCFLLGDAGARALVSERELAAALPQDEPEQVALLPVPRLLLPLAEAPDAGDAAAAGDVGDAGDLAYVIYTSGSTGEPKGVMVSHAQVARLLTATRERFELGPEDVWTLFHSSAFDFSVWETWGALAHGGRLVVVPYWQSRSPAELLALLEREGVTVLNQTPLAFRLLAAEALGRPAQPELALRLVVFGGDALVPRTLASWCARCGDERPRLVNMYGITETTVHVTWRRLRAADAEHSGSPIGVPLPDLELHLLDRFGQPVPPGVPGELWVGGAGVAVGYLGRPALTAARFRPDPFSERAGARLYRSGDLARRAHDGGFDYLGRADRQLKVRGFRVEPGEVEAALAAHPGVRQAVVLAQAEAGEADRLVAWFTWRGEAPPDGTELRRFLAARLPEPLLPGIFVPLAELPLTANGKLDRRRLLAPPLAPPGAERPRVAPRDARERALGALWAETLGREGAGIDDNFFASGGDSIRAVRLVGLALERGLDLTVQDLFRHQTIGELAAALAAREGAGRPEAAEGAAVAAAPAAELPPGVEDIYPLARLQVGMLFHAAAEPERLLYHEVASHRLRGPLVPRALQEAAEELAARHGVLRTSFDLEAAGGGVQRVHRQVHLPVEIEELRHLAPERQDEAVAAWFEAEKRRRFDPARAPLLRLKLHVLGDDLWELGLTEHHAILDGWSVATLTTELVALYLARLGLGAPPPPPPAASYREFVAGERAAAASVEARAYWTALSARAPVTRLPPGETTGAGEPELLRAAAPPELAASLGALARRARLPLKSLLLAVHARVLAHLSGEREVTTGVVTNGRPELPGAERMLGLFLNTLPMPLRVAGGDWLALAVQALTREQEALPHRRYPLAELQRVMGGTAPFTVVFNYDHFHACDALLAHPALRYLGSRFFQRTNFALLADWNLDIASGELELRLSRDGREIGAALAERFASACLQALAALAASPEAPWEAAPLMWPTETAQLTRHAPPAPADAAAVPEGGAAATLVPEGGEIERAVTAIWEEVLGRTGIGRTDNFFDLGGQSLLLLRLQARLAERFGRRLALPELFHHPTVAALAAHLAVARVPVGASAAAGAADGAGQEEGPADAGEPIAVIGMAGRFPGAEDVDALWRNLADGVVSIARFTRAELAAAGIPQELLDLPGYVPAAGVLSDVYGFDAAFFDLSPREADWTDPQQRLFLECSWEALEDAGHGPGSAVARRERIGVFAGMGMGTYLLAAGGPARAFPAGFGLQAMLGNDKDFLPTRVSYKLDLKGPSVGVQTACSTALVAVHLACKALRDGECDLALAGAVTVRFPHPAGYLYEEGGIVSPDGHCRPFDAAAAGTVGGSGAGVVVLRRLAAARADRDPVRAVIRGSAVNNDGAQKLGYTAPSVTGQAEVVATALGAARVAPETVSYVETHGTGTAFGDPVETAALAQGFRAAGGLPRRCTLGAVKANLGHLDTAAGAAGLIKAVLALEHRALPGTPGFRTPHPDLDLGAGAFRLDAQLAPWENGAAPRRAGVSALGMGGTNAHAVLEEAPPPEPGGPSRPWQILALAARTPGALAAARAALTAHLAQHPALPLADAAHTLRTGRKAFRHRLAVVCQAASDLAAPPPGAETAGEAAAPPPVAFLLPGQGAQRAGMGVELLTREPVFARELAACAELLAPDLDLPAVLRSETLLARTAYAQPALFAVEYALARLWISWGVVPVALLGHSLGEYVAACLAGVWPLADALRLVAARARLMESCPPGGMLPVPLGEAEARALVGDGPLELAAVNAPDRSVVAGPADEVAALARRLGLAAAGGYGFHSALVEPALAAVGREIARLAPAPPRIPYLSCLTGGWVRAEQAAHPDYWTAQMRRPVRFADAAGELLRGGFLILEVGPGDALSGLVRRLARRRPAAAGGPPREPRFVLASLPGTGGAGPLGEQEAMLRALARLWVAGVEIDWHAFAAGERRRRVRLPTYPFERRQHRLGAAPEADAASAPVLPLAAGRGPAQTAPSAGAPPPAAAAGVAATVARACAEVLGMAEVSPEDDFFALGGDSVAALQLVARLRESGLRLTTRQVFEARTAAALAALAGPVAEAPATPPAAPLPQASPTATPGPEAMPHAAARWAPPLISLDERTLRRVERLLAASDGEEAAEAGA